MEPVWYMNNEVNDEIVSTEDHQLDVYNPRCYDNHPDAFRHWIVQVATDIAMNCNSKLENMDFQFRTFHFFKNCQLTKSWKSEKYFTTRSRSIFHFEIFFVIQSWITMYV